MLADQFLGLGHAGRDHAVQEAVENALAARRLGALQRIRRGITGDRRPVTEDTAAEDMVTEDMGILLVLSEKTGGRSPRYPFFLQCNIASEGDRRVVGLTHRSHAIHKK